MDITDKLNVLQGDIAVKSAELQSVTLSAKKQRQDSVDTEEALDTIQDAIEHIQGLRKVIIDIKMIVKDGVKWYEVFKLASIVGDVVKIIKSYEWDLESNS